MSLKHTLIRLLDELASVGARGKIAEHVNGDDITSISLVVHGPLLGPEIEALNNTVNAESQGLICCRAE